jgi:MinD superfamily P-loop ATPase|tara:strand:- start:3013 stop:3240 length:228 start_codon:yes stop_codon:yes gene_type:complete
MVKKKLVKKAEKEKPKICSNTCNGCGSCFYGLGFLGAAIYYISTATGFWVGVLGVLKAIVWPAFLVFELLKLIGA